VEAERPPAENPFEAIRRERGRREWYETSKPRKRRGADKQNSRQQLSNKCYDDIEVLTNIIVW
jgi:hypothetical protein